MAITDSKIPFSCLIRFSEIQLELLSFQTIYLPLYSHNGLPNKNIIKKSSSEQIVELPRLLVVDKQSTSWYELYQMTKDF
jgi:hypothetical protein